MSVKLMGTVLCKTVCFWRRTPITLSICILREARHLVFSKSTGSSCFFPWVNAGIFNSAWHLRMDSLTRKPLFAKTTSPGSKWDKKSYFVLWWTYHLCDLPIQWKWNLEGKLQLNISLCGVICMMSNTEHWLAIYWVSLELFQNNL